MGFSKILPLECTGVYLLSFGYSCSSIFRKEKKRRDYLWIWKHKFRAYSRKRWGELSGDNQWNGRWMDDRGFKLPWWEKAIFGWPIASHKKDWFPSATTQPQRWPLLSYEISTTKWARGSWTIWNILKIETSKNQGALHLIRWIVWTAIVWLSSHSTRKLLNSNSSIWITFIYSYMYRNSFTLILRSLWRQQPVWNYKGTHWYKKQGIWDTDMGQEYKNLTKI